MILIGLWHHYLENIFFFQVNHAQVASGEVEQGVIDNDIDAELTEEEAHDIYGVRVADWLALNALHLGALDASQAQDALLNFVIYKAETDAFLLPFIEAYQMEQMGYSSQHVQNSQVRIYN